MKILKLEYINNRMLPFIKERSRMLEFYLIQNLLNGNYEEEVLVELKKFQNEDGGFGNALEPDIRMPESSVIATAFAVMILDELRTPKKENILKEVISYFEDTYDESILGWGIVPQSVNNYPRAIWWNYESINQFDYGNPTAEIIGFLYKNKDHLKKIDIDKLISKMTTYILEQYNSESEHTLYSIIRYYEKMPKEIKYKIEPIILDNIEKIVNLNEDKWHEYVPQPYNLIQDKEHKLYSKYEDELNKNLDFIINIINDDGVWTTPWEWYQFEEEFENTAKYDWLGHIAYKRLKTLKKFNRIV